MMDRPDAPAAVLAEDLENLVALNRFFGGRGVIRRRVRPLLERLRPGEPLSVLDVGSGAGDLCRTVVHLGREIRHPVGLVSLDFHAPIQAYARRCCAAYPEIRFLRGDARRLPLPDGAVDLALCTLALHHFTEADAVLVLAELRRVTRRWALVSDLCRSPQALAGVWLATRLSRNPMTRFDGPASVRRAFTREELAALAREAGWGSASTQPEPWFRMSLFWEKGG